MSGYDTILHLPAHWFIRIRHILRVLLHLKLLVTAYGPYIMSGRNITWL
jgi:hypothetical protein